MVCAIWCTTLGKAAKAHPAQSAAGIRRGARHAIQSKKGAMTKNPARER